MQRGALKSMQVVETCTSAVVRRMAPLWRVGILAGPSGTGTRLLFHLCWAVGTRSRISELSPLVANRTTSRFGFGALPDANTALRVSVTTSVSHPIAAARQPLRTARV